MTMDSLNLNRKRRRVEQSASALSKPFKSPLRRPAQTSTSNGEEVASSTSLNHTINRNGQNISTYKSSSTPGVDNNSPITAPSATAGRKRRILGEQLPAPTKQSLSVDSTISSLQRQLREHQTRLLSLHSELDTVQQALRIETSNRDEELEKLITKWKTVSQNAAEEVLSGAQERIQRMGGLKIWRERTKNDAARWEQEEMASWFGNLGPEVDEDELEARRAEMRDEREVIEEDERHKDGDDVEPQEFTMETMLKSLNIELKAIGYDRSTQSWAKE